MSSGGAFHGNYTGRVVSIALQGEKFYTLDLSYVEDPSVEYDPCEFYLGEI